MCCTLQLGTIYAEASGLPGDKKHDRYGNAWVCVCTRQAHTRMDLGTCNSIIGTRQAWNTCLIKWVLVAKSSPSWDRCVIRLGKMYYKSNYLQGKITCRISSRYNMHFRVPRVAHWPWQKLTLTLPLQAVGSFAVSEAVRESDRSLVFGINTSVFWSVIGNSVCT